MAMLGLAGVSKNVCAIAQDDLGRQKALKRKLADQGKARNAQANATYLTIPFSPRETPPSHPHFTLGLSFRYYTIHQSLYLST